MQECEEWLLTSGRTQHRILSLTVNTRHFICMAYSLNCTVAHQFESIIIIITHFTDKETEAEF